MTKKTNPAPVLETVTGFPYYINRLSIGGVKWLPPVQRYEYDTPWK